MMASIVDIEGIGPVYREKLVAYGIKTVEALLKQGASSGGRSKISYGTGIPSGLILEWVNHADLWRIKGVSEEYSDLLEEAGVDTVVELAQRNPENLYAKIKEVNMAKKLVRRLPSARQVADWVVQAKGLPRVVTY
jgi:predicted flap endonuclease-1-like 5' DNA nuclease